MESMTVTRRIEAPREEVWAAMTDLESMPERISGITRIERLTPHTHVCVGARWRETRVMMGREATEEMEATEVDPPARYVVEAESNGARYRSVFTFTEVEGGTEVMMSFGAEPLTATARIMAKVTGPLARRAVHKAIVADLDDVAASFNS